MHLMTDGSSVIGFSDGCIAGKQAMMDFFFINLDGEGHHECIFDVVMSIMN